jgi:hypothetical protein
MTFVRHFLSFLIGCAIGLVFHYALYRMALPSQPFIYMAF